MLNKLFLGDFGPYGLDGITQIFQLRIYDVTIGALLDCGLVTVEATGAQ